MFPAQMETRGPHVAFAVFPRRSGAKAGRPDFQTSAQNARPEPSQAFPSPGPQLPRFQWPPAQPLAFASAYLAELPHHVLPEPRPLPHWPWPRPGVLWIGVPVAQQWRAGCPRPSGPWNRPQTLETRAWWLRALILGPNYLSSNQVLLLASCVALGKYLPFCASLTSL